MPAQLPDRILYHQEYCNLCTNPLEWYWTTSGKTRPPFVARDDCKRGYVATWEIRDNQLFLREIEGQVKRKFRLWGKRVDAYSIGKLLGKKKTMVKAVWFSGKLRIPSGKMILFDDHGYDSRFEKEVIITITRGEVDRVVTLDYANQKLIVNE